MAAKDPRWPNLFIPGGPKCGTTSLHRYLAQHPDIFMSEPKEPHFFSFTWDEHEEDLEGLSEATEAYLALFEGGEANAIRGESTPGYLHRPPVAARIHERVPDAKFVVLLRDPIERAHSDHAMLVRKGSEDRTFLEAIQAEVALDDPTKGYHIQRSLYDASLQRYLDRFTEDQVHVVLSEDLKHDTLAVLEQIAAFLGIDPDPMAQVDYETLHNPGGSPRNALAAWLLNDERVHRAARALLPKPLRVYLGDHALISKDEKPPLEPEAVDLLVPIFEPSVTRLEEMLDRRLPELRRTWSLAKGA
ncbi:MAG: sulfotransferase [Candidatus Thermoplasmatota archaeon]|nr:sulfotransferase [Candidatus Thermoplasmatota archaeon]